MRIMVYTIVSMFVFQVAIFCSPYCHHGCRFFPRLIHCNIVVSILHFSIFCRGTEIMFSET